MSAGTRWAGVMSDEHVYDPASFAHDQDVLRIVDASKAVFERTQRKVPWRLVDGRLELALGGGITVTYTRLSDGPQGEQRWLAERRTYGALDWLLEVPVVKVQEAAVFTHASLVAKWSSNLNAAFLSDPFFTELLDDGRAKRYGVINGVVPNVTPRGAWTISADGRTMLLDTVGNGCAQGLGCSFWSRREWQLQAIAGDDIVVMEKLDVPGALAWRLVTWTRSP